MSRRDRATAAPHELRALAALFLRLGATSFGGPAAHVAMMEEEVVRRRRWLAREEFLDLLAASQLIPGPNSTELALHIGHRRAGWPGLLVAGACFILPAMAIVWGVAWAYVGYGTLPPVMHALAGVKPVVLAIVLQALARLAGAALTSAMTLAIAAVALVATLMGVHELVVLLGAGALAWLDWRMTRGGNLWERGGGAAALVAPAGPSFGPLLREGPNAAPIAEPGTTPLLASLLPAAAAGGAAAVSLGGLFGAFLKIGALLFGSGYVLIAFLRADLVQRSGWLTEPQLLDAIAVGQFTPGPLFTTATFVGFLVAGHAGALVATLGIFLPAFVYVAFTAPVVARLRASAAVRATLGGLNAASLALIAAVSVPLARDALAHPALAQGRVLGAVFGGVLMLATLAALRWTRVNSAWLVLAGGAIGILAAR